ncbi:uncharacterized protein LOC110694925 [Chenopodium quinoa]|uniref:uncharacterized protein LOC110694925 n=1 Tax=Chenopodium quinoa TaxID=63459 RepID=UPI000B7779B7|nr:uncharacterized protein LOC110694925 [Chenopodium quinoa]
MNKPGKLCDVLCFMRHHNMGLFGLLETKVRGKNFRRVFGNFGRDWSVITNHSVSDKVRVLIVWLPSIFSVESCKIDVQFVHVCITHIAMRKKFWLTMVYGLSTVAEREGLWAHISKISPPGDDPWILCGDFNNILNLEDRIGSQCTLAEVEQFRSYLRMNNLTDFNVGGLYYTWTNKQGVEDRVCTKIDRAIVNDGWLNMFPNFSAEFLPKGLMDHTPCCMNLDTNAGNTKKPFRFFNMWTDAPCFHDIVQKVWDRPIQGTTMYRVVKKLKALKHDLKLLNLTHFSSIESTDLATSKVWAEIQRKFNADPTNTEFIQQEHEPRIAYNEAHTARFLFLKQKAKTHWLKEGDGGV